MHEGTGNETNAWVVGVDMPLFLVAPIGMRSNVRPTKGCEHGISVRGDPCKNEL